MKIGKLKVEVLSVPRFRASPRHGGARRFNTHCLVSNPPRGALWGGGPSSQPGVWGDQTPLSVPERKRFSWEIIVKWLNRPPAPALPLLGAHSRIRCLGITCTLLFQNDQVIQRYRNPEMPQRRGRCPRRASGLYEGFSMRFKCFRDRLTGVETPIPPIMIYAAAPDGAPPRRINDWYF